MLWIQHVKNLKKRCVWWNTQSINHQREKLYVLPHTPHFTSYTSLHNIYLYFPLIGLPQFSRCWHPFTSRFSYSPKCRFANTTYQWKIHPIQHTHNSLFSRIANLFAIALAFNMYIKFLNFILHFNKFISRDAIYTNLPTFNICYKLYNNVDN